MTGNQLAKQATRNTGKGLARRLRRTLGPFGVFFQGFLENPRMVGSVIPSSRVTIDAMLEQVDDTTRVIFIANPNNPTGTWLQRDELKAFLDNVPADVVVVLDEAYTQYVEDRRFPDGIEWLADYPNLIVTRTFSKIYGLAGLRVGYGIASPDLLGVIGRLRAPFNVSLPALAAAEKALEDEEFLRQSIQTNRDGMQQLITGFTELGLTTIPSVGNFLCVEFNRPGLEIYEALLK